MALRESEQASKLATTRREVENVYRVWKVSQIPLKQKQNIKREGKEYREEEEEMGNVILLTFHSTYHLYVCLVYNYIIYSAWYCLPSIKYSRAFLWYSCEIENKFKMTQFLFSLHNKRQHKQNITQKQDFL